MSQDPTRIKITPDPRTRRISGTTAHGFIPFDAPFVSEIAPSLWQGGCTTGLILPNTFKHLVSLYPWEQYRVKHDLISSVSVRMLDGLGEDMGQIRLLAGWVNACRRTGPVLVHCFPPGTLVGASTPTPIEDATEVLGHDGRLHKVTAHHSREYSGELVVLRTTGALPVRCTPEHPILVVRPYYFPAGFMAKPGMKSLERVSTVVRHYADQPVWLPADEVRAGDFVVSPRLSACAEPSPIAWPTAGVNSRPVGDLVPDDDTAWMLGLYAADGGTIGLNSISFTLSPTDDLERLRAAWRSMGLEPAVRRHENYVRVTVNSRAVRTAMSEWCGKGNAKRLPDFILRDGWPLASVIEGYAAGDGYVNVKGAIACRCISPLLVEQIRTALVACGESPTVCLIRRTSGYPNAKPIYEVQWSPVATQRHTAWWRGQYLLPVTGVERETYSGMVYNLAVADAETFTVNGIVTHNCQAGLNRSSLVVASALMLEGASAAEAIRLIREKRSSACLCNPAFEGWLRSQEPQALRAQCPGCQRMILVRRDGRLRMHKASYGVTCGGSDRAVAAGEMAAAS
jgi:protein-tyrosine phosphatase